MNYTQFYKNANRRSVETLLSLWAAGEKDYQDYFKYLFENEEKLLAEPVFQATFPWESGNRTFDSLNELFSQQFINGLNHEFLDENNRLLYPYKHQLASWNALLTDKKSIVVTSGTGSGKTECFMYPVLQDIMSNKEDGVQALFIYPLNALIGSQKKRMHDRCKRLGNIRWGIYNGKTEENVNSVARVAALPEIISRTEIRQNPPRILFTNPTMLEYMMVRDKDQNILSRSHGKLKWIILDEAHTYTGSAAAEMALLIRRVLDAFGVNAENVRFAATSATMGNPNDPEIIAQLKNFMSQLSGKTETQIEIITAKRTIPELNTDVIPYEFANKELNYNIISELRFRLNNSDIPAIKVTEIANDQSIENSLEFIDALSNPIDNLMIDGSRGAIIPTRGHFFARSIGGAAVCINPNCNIHQGQRSPTILGTITTHLKTQCECGAPMLELVRCSKCGEFLAIGEINNNIIRPSKTTSNESLFEIDNEPNDEDVAANVNQQVINGWKKIVLAKKTERLHPVDSSSIRINNQDNVFTISEGEGDDFGYVSDEVVCPCCRAGENNFNYLRFGNSFLNRMLSYSLLEQAPSLNNGELVWGGRKYIAFTDSRQGTAKNARSQNYDTERIWIQSRVFHYLCFKRTENMGLPLNEIERQQLEVYRANPFIFANLIAELEVRDTANFNPDMLQVSTISWNELFNRLKDYHVTSRELEILCKGILNKNGNNETLRNYLNWLLIDQFSKRPKRANSPENLGLVRCVYPRLNDCIAPRVFLDLHPALKDSHWRDYLKICIDYFIRENLFIHVTNDVKSLRTSKFFRNKRIYPFGTHKIDANGNTIEIDTWRLFENNTSRPNRLILMLCAINRWDKNDIDNTKRDQINEILRLVWNQLIQSNILIGDSDNGYVMDLSSSMSFEALKEAWVCPITNKPIDVNFMGYSPRMTGSITQSTYNRYTFKTNSHIDFPCFPYADRKNCLVDNSEIDNDTSILNWINQKFVDLQERGLWTNIHERIYLKPEIFLSAEHSAQLDGKVLKIIEDKFEKGEVNILSCSTTMEMGVDIGGISEVVMNNVPPSPANYLQRAGRAGRRSETKSLALTFCGANPIGRNAMENPLWTMTHNVAMPKVRFESPAIVQRHINSYLFAKFVTQNTLIQQGIAVTSKVMNFFGASDDLITDYIPNTRFEQFLQFLINCINTENDNLNIGLNKIKYNTVLENQQINSVINTCLDNIRIVNLNYIDNLNELNQSIQDLKANGFNENSPAIRSLLFKRGTLFGKHLLSYMAEKLFLPNASMPTGLVEFDITNIKDIQQKMNKQAEVNNADATQEDNTYISVSSENPTFHISRALADYAPGRNVVINQYTYISEGVQLKSIWKDSTIQKLSKCINGHTILFTTNHATCHCGSPLLAVHNGDNKGYTEVIEPAGFSVDIRKEASRVNDDDDFSIIETELINTTDWSVGNNAISIEAKTGLDDSEILYYNNGTGYGYGLCIHCGRSVKENNLATTTDGMLHNHRRLRGGKNNQDNTNEFCSGSDNNMFGIRRNILLVGRLQTNFIELRFSIPEGGYINDIETIRSLGVLLSQELAHSLGINESEISYGIKHYNNFKSVYLFDVAKGGAGYSNQFLFYTQNILDSARERMKNCTCSKACTKCLINRESQWHLDELDRHKTMEWLNLEFNSRREIPQHIKNISPNSRRITRDISSEIYSIIQPQNVEELTFFVNNNSDMWNFDAWKVINEVKKQKLIYNKIVNFVVIGQPVENRNTFLLINELKSWSNVFSTIDSHYPIKPLFTVKIRNANGFTFRSYFSEATNNSFDERWGNDMPVFYDTIERQWNILDMNPQLPTGSNIEIVYINEQRLYSKNVAHSLKGKLTHDFWSQIEGKFTGKQVTISYSDRYVLSKFNSMLLLQFISEFVHILNLEVEHLQFNFSPINSLNNAPLKIWDNWNRNNDRLVFISNALIDIENLSDVEFNLNMDINAAHFRQLIIESEDNVLTIQPDGGFGQGWSFDKFRGDGNGDYETVDSSDDLPIYNTTGSNGIQYVIVIE